MHIPGVGYSTERRLWENGAQSWDDFKEMVGSLDTRPELNDTILKAIDKSDACLKKGDQCFFIDTLPKREYWRAYQEFKNDTAFLDIETTGLSPDKDPVTVIGLYNGYETMAFVRGDNLNDFKSAVKKYKVLVTFNGARFDLPFLQKAFPKLRFDQLHIDLRYPLRRLGLVGGLKAIEKRIGIRRSEETKDLSGWDAVRLWRAHERGESGALETLIEYNAEDVRNLETLIDLSYCTLRTIYLKHGFTSADQWRDNLRMRVP